MSVPIQPKIYHIMHVDRLPSIIVDNNLWCDVEIAKRAPSGTGIGMKQIKERRINKTLASHSNLHVSECVNAIKLRKKEVK